MFCIQSQGNLKKIISKNASFRAGAGAKQLLLATSVGAPTGTQAGSLALLLPARVWGKQCLVAQVIALMLLPGPALAVAAL